MWRRTTTSRFFRPADLRYGWVACGFLKHFTCSLPESQIRQKFIRSYAMCSFTYPSRESQIFHYCIAVGLLLVLPLSIGIFSYYKIFLKTNERQHNVVSWPQNRTESGSVTNSLKEININRVLLYVAAGFFCCWIPMWALTLLVSFETCARIAVLLATFLHYFSAFRKQFQNLLVVTGKRSAKCSCIN